ncbi:MAG TPA: tyrosine-type recombinase/integrase, partial [Microthrixaceae bacterium]|nr:tyrosine-type recombinase/integrase [Microthrixaceae bacterium]
MLAIPQKLHDTAIVTFLTHDETQALLAAPDPARWEGRRDRALLAVAVQTGLRLAELTGLDTGDIATGVGAHLTCTGKGRKQRVVPLTTNTVAVLHTWTRERGGHPTDPLFPTRTGRRLSPDAVQRRVALHTATAAHDCCRAPRLVRMVVTGSVRIVSGRVCSPGCRGAHSAVT